MFVVVLVGKQQLRLCLFDGHCLPVAGCERTGKNKGMLGSCLLGFSIFVMVIVAGCSSGSRTWCYCVTEIQVYKTGAWCSCLFILDDTGLVDT